MYVYDFYDRGDLCIQGTSFARKRLIAYMYVLRGADNQYYQLHDALPILRGADNLRVSDLLRTCTSSALEATYAYEERLLRVSDLCLKVFLAYVNVAMTVNGVEDII